MSDTITTQMRQRMEKSIGNLKKDLNGIRGNRASITLLDAIQVDYYGTLTPLSQVATLSTPEPRLITVTPWDKSAINDIEKAIQAADLGVSPSNDGTTIRLAMPPLSEERRRELVKLIKKMVEDTKISIRHIRRDGNDQIKKQLKDKELTEDDEKRIGKEIQEATDQCSAKVDEIFTAKERDIMEV